MSRLVGQELINHIHAHAGEPQSDTIESAGYYTIRQGKRVLNRTDFMTAMAAANGLELGPKTTGRKAPRKPKGKIKVTPRGVIALSACYAEMIGITPGEYVQVDMEDGYLVISPQQEPEPQPQSGIGMTLAA